MADKKTLQPPKQPVEEHEESVVHDEPKRRGWNVGNVLWGLLLVMIGTLFLLQNLGVLDINLVNLWLLWPVLIIIAGASLVVVRGWVGVLVSVVAALLTVGLVTMVVLDVIRPGDMKQTRMDEVSVVQPKDSIKDIQLTIEAGAGEIVVNSHEKTAVLNATLKSTGSQLRHDASTRGTTQTINVAMDGASRWWTGPYENKLTATLTRTLPVDLTLDTGATQVRADLSQVMLRQLNIDSGASNIDVKLGSSEALTNVEYDIGASAITFHVPRSSGVSLWLDSGLSGTDLPDLKEVSKGYYESANYATATNKIAIRGKMGMANLKIQYYE